MHKRRRSGTQDAQARAWQRARDLECNAALQVHERCAAYAEHGVEKMLDQYCCQNALLPWRAMHLPPTGKYAQFLCAPCQGFELRRHYFERQDDGKFGIDECTLSNGFGHLIEGRHGTESVA